MAKPIIRFDDRTGKLVKSKIWQMGFVDADNGDQKIPLYAISNPIEKIPSDREVKKCPLYKRHVTDLEYLSIPIDLFGERLRDFVVMDNPVSVVSAQFADRLRKTDLSGFKLRSIVKVVCNQSDVKDPKLFHLEFVGRGGRSNRLVVEGGPNSCPHCNKTPMVCPGCGFTNWPVCLECEKWTLFNPDAPEYSDPKGFVLKGYPPQSAHCRWQGVGRE